MVTYLIRRLLWALVLFVAVTLVTYLVFYVIPADPARLACGQRATAECIQNAEHRLGLDRPVPIQYALFLKRLVIEHSLGNSFTNRRDVNLRNALLPIVTMPGMDIGIALGGAIFTEAIFGLPGLGRLAVQALETFDLPLIQGVVVFSTLCIIVFNIIVFVAYAFIDPRIRLN